VTAAKLANLFIRACPSPGREVDIEVFGRQVTAMLCEIPEAVARAVMDPVKGLAIKCEFFPKPKEVADAIAEAMGPHRRMAERIRRAEEFKRVVGAEAEVSQEARDRAFEHWQAQKEAMSGKEPPEVTKAKAETLLREGWRDKRWDTNVHPVKVSDELRRNLAAKAKPDYVPLETGQSLQGKRDDE
jgi:hypothetical protein